MNKEVSFLSSVKTCASIFKIRTAEGFQYRTAALTGAATGIFWALIEITVFIVFYTYADKRDAGILAGLSLRQVVSYAWLTQVLFHMQVLSLDSDILSKINSGDVGIELCRPLSLYSHWFAKSAAGKLAPIFWRGPITLIAGILMPASYSLSPPASMDGFFWMLVSLLAAFLLCSSFGMLMTAVRLNIVWGDGPVYLIMLIGMVLSGSYLPLQLWPKFMQSFLILQPFAGYLDIPLRLYLGTLSAQNALWAVGLQLAWSILFIISGRLLMAKQLKSIIVQGG